MKNSLGISIVVDKDGFIDAEVRSLNDHDKEIEALAEGNGFNTAKWMSLEELKLAAIGNRDTISITIDRHRRQFELD